MSKDDKKRESKKTTAEESTDLEIPTRRKQGGTMSKIRKRVTDRNPMDAVVFEARVLLGAIFAVLLAMLIWTVAVATDFWFHVNVPNSGTIYMNRTNSFFVRSHSGIWTICKYEIQNGTQNGPIIRSCHNHRLFPTTEQIQKNPEVDRTILDYTRTEIAFSIISYCLMVMGLGFSIYAFKHPRYTFKRLAGGVHFISAVAILVVIEVVVNSVRYEENYLTDRHPKGAQWTYGYSFIVAWMAFILLIISGIAFIVCSRKKKGDRAVGMHSGDDEPHIIGRL